MGGDVTLLCGSDPRGNPDPVAEWRDNNGTVVPDDGRFSIVSDSSEVSLTIQGVTANDAGDWQCSLTVEADNRTIGDTVVRSITLFVVGKNCFFSKQLTAVTIVFKGMIASVCYIPGMVVST